MVGNPGVGKSSTINSLVGQILFESGPSFNGSGITSQLDIRQCNGQTFLDTPGLNDLKKRQAAATAIEQALKEPGQYRLFFIVTEQEGRIRPDDLTTLKLVMDALNHKEDQIKDNAYSILVNKLQPVWLRKMRQKKGAEEAWKRVILDTLTSGGSPTTNRIHLAPMIPDMIAEDNKLADLDPEVRAFFDT